MRICNNCKEFIKYIFENRYDVQFELPDSFCKNPLESDGKKTECYEYILNCILVQPECSKREDAKPCDECLRKYFTEISETKRLEHTSVLAMHCSEHCENTANNKLT